jgi:hypothetical protein
MKQNKIGLVGIGKLGTALMKQWNDHNITIGVYHPSEIKAEHFIKKFQSGYILSENELQKIDILILALPAKEVIPFIADLCAEDSSTIIINMATALNTKEISARFPSYKVLGVKYMGHSRDLLEHGNGLFITESSLPKGIEELFQSLGSVEIDHEDILIEVNKLATYYALKTAVDIEKEFCERALPPEYVKRALTSLAPEVIRSYSDGSLGHFAKEIVKEIQLKTKKDADNRPRG